MIVYHGSNRNFKKLRIAKELVRTQSSLVNEGMGIYFSTDKEVAKSYGKYIYTIEINDRCFLDFRARGRCRIYLGKLAQKIYKELKIDILDYINLEETADRMYWGGLAISGVGREIYLLLDSNEKWYKEVCKSKIERVYQILRTYDKRNLQAYMFNYHIKDVGVIKTTDENVVRIVSKENSY